MIGPYGAVRTSRRGTAGFASPAPAATLAAVLLSACATERLGPPVHVSELQGVRTLTHEARDATRLRGLGAIPPRTASFRCDTVVVVAQGRVRAFDLRGNGCGG